MVSCFWDFSEMCCTAPGGIGGGTDMLIGISVNIWMQMKTDDFSPLPLTKLKLSQNVPAMSFSSLFIRN